MSFLSHLTPRSGDQTGRGQRPLPVWDRRPPVSGPSGWVVDRSSLTTPNWTGYAPSSQTSSLKGFARVRGSVVVSETWHDSSRPGAVHLSGSFRRTRRLGPHDTGMSSPQAQVRRNSTEGFQSFRGGGTGCCRRRRSRSRLVTRGGCTPVVGS